jgi:hypothetical protein
MNERTATREEQREIVIYPEENIRVVYVIYTSGKQDETCPRCGSRDFAVHKKRDYCYR